MSILVDENTKLLVQGITGREGSLHTKRCMEYGTKVVAGVTPGKGGMVFEDKVPVFNTVSEAAMETGANVSMIFVPPHLRADDAIVEAVDAGISVVVCITEKIPVADSVRMVRYVKNRQAILIGPNCPGIISPGAKCKVGIMPGNIHRGGRVGVVSRSGTLTYEAVGQLTGSGIGQSTCVGIGGDPVSGTTFVDILKMFSNDPDTDAVVLIGEIGGSREQEAAEYIQRDFSKPIAALIVGRSAPPGRRMGHAGAIITGSAGRADEKTKALASAGAAIVPGPAYIAETVRELISIRLT